MQRKKSLCGLFSKFAQQLEKSPCENSARSTRFFEGCASAGFPIAEFIRARRPYSRLIYSISKNKFYFSETKQIANK